MDKKKLARIASLSLLLAGALTACGKKGPLYLPDQASEVVTRPAAAPAPEAPAAPATDAEKDKDKKARDAAPTTPQQ